MRNRNTLLGILAAAFVILAGGCLLHSLKGQQEVSASRELFAMDTVMKLEAYGRKAQDAVDAAAAEIQRLDALFSTGKENSEISLLNRNGKGEVSSETLEVIQEGCRLHKDTDGLFDLTIYPLMKLWGFTDKQYHVPTSQELERVLPLVDADRVTISGSLVTLGEGQELDLGGIAKGYASARIMDIYREYGITSGLVSLGGNIQALGAKPDGSSWNIGIRDPEGTQGELTGVLQVQDQAVITSGGYERYFEENGRTYIHILDPRTGCPADSDLASVSIAAGDGMLADALSTSLYLMGYQGAAAYWRNSPELFDMVLVTKDGKIYVTEGIANRFQAGEAFEVIKRS